VDRTHPSLAGASLTSVETLVSGDCENGPVAEHGTHVASVLFARHDGPVKGIAPRCRGLIAPIFKDMISGAPAPCSQVDLARALLQVVQAGANIINVSGGQLAPEGVAHPILTDAVRACAQSGALIVAAAGNQGCDCLHIPGALPSVLAVGAMNAQGEPLPFSNWGGAYQSQGILAPGENILGADPEGGTAVRTGTSFATPIVSGVCALLLSLQYRYGQKPNPQEVRNALLQSAQGCEHGSISDCRRLLAGRLSVRGAVSFITRGIRTMSAPPEITTPLESHTPNPAAMAGPPAAGALASACAAGPNEASAVPPSRGGALAVPEAVVESPRVTPSGGCGCKAGPAPLVYALGMLGYDFGTEARRDWFISAMGGANLNPTVPRDLEAFFQGNAGATPPLEGHPEAADAVIWTLSFDATPIYAIQPRGPYAAETHLRLRSILQDEYPANPPTKGQGVVRVAVPGYISGSVKLFSGQTVPVIHPDLRGMFDWTTQALVAAVKDQLTGIQNVNPDDEINNFLQRIYYEFRNLGVTSRDRALNYTGTVAVVFGNAIQAELGQGYHLDTIDVQRSTVCRPESDCWDVMLTFYNPRSQMDSARHRHIFPVDVSDVIPVVLGPPKTFYVH
jgi:cyanobactin maturation PatA/PatG family protease